MKFSVIIPVYNVSAYLRRCVLSVQQQTYKSLEIILVDDGSTDGSGLLCDELAMQDSRIQVIHKANGGLSDARNAGLSIAQGEYVLFLDSDDYYATSSVVETLNANLEREDYPDVLLFCRQDYYDDLNRGYNERPYDCSYINACDLPQQVFEYLLNQQRFNMSACFQTLKRTVLVNNNIWFVKGLRNEDIDWSLQLWRVIHSVKAINMYAYVYWHRADSITTTTSILDIRSYDYMFNKWQHLLQPQQPYDLLYLQYLAFVFPTIVYSYYTLPRSDRKEAFRLIKGMIPILQYASTPKAKRIQKVCQVVGIRFTVMLFGLYGKLKPVIRRLRK